jgi:hypothetical protein
LSSHALETKPIALEVVSAESQQQDEGDWNSQAKQNQRTHLFLGRVLYASTDLLSAARFDNVTPKVTFRAHSKKPAGDAGGL